MKEFPLNQLELLNGKIESHLWSIEPFKVYYKFNIQSNSIKIESESETFENILGGDFMDLNIKSYDELINQNRSFPDNPIDGYIDASIYYQTVHHPVYINEILFKGISKGKLMTNLNFKIFFEYEGSTFKNTDFINRNINLEIGNLVIDREDIIETYSFENLIQNVRNNIDLSNYEFPIIEEYESWISNSEKILRKIIKFKYKDYL